MIRQPNVEVEQVICFGRKEYDFDIYNFEARTPISTQETSVTVDFGENKIYGDRVAYGEWFDIEVDECIELLATLQPHEIKRDFSSLINQYNK